MSPRHSVTPRRLELGHDAGDGAVVRVGCIANTCGSLPEPSRRLFPAWPGRVSTREAVCVEEDILFVLLLSPDVHTPSYRWVATFRGRPERRNYLPQALLEKPNGLSSRTTYKRCNEPHKAGKASIMLASMTLVAMFVDSGGAVGVTVHLRNHGGRQAHLAGPRLCRNRIDGNVPCGGTVLSPRNRKAGGATLHLPTRLPLTCPTTDHTHREEELLDDSSALLLNTGALVDGSYRIVAVDNNGVATTTATARHWPIVLITAPVDRVLGGKNLYAHPFPRAGRIPSGRLSLLIRRLSRLSATIFLDDREAGQMQRVSNDETHRLNSLWQGTYDATALGPGEHKITVRAECQRAAML